MVFKLPEIIDPEKKSSRPRRVQNAAVRYALIEVLKLHHRHRIKEHFKQGAKRKYRHFPRHEVTIKKKRKHWGSLPDLVKTGSLRTAMRTGKPKMFVRGKAESGSVRGVMRLAMPPKFRQFPGARGVTRDKMADEIGRFTEDEKRVIAEKEFMKFYRRHIENELRKRKRADAGIKSLLG